MTHFDLAIIGSGSGNSLITPDWRDKRVALIEGATFGGTCLNTGCIPTKMYVYAAEVAQTIRHAARFGVDAQLDRVRWRDVRDRIFDRVDPISADGERYRRHSENVTYFAGQATFDGERSLVVRTGAGTERVTASCVVIAAGARPVVPDVIAHSRVAFHTSDTVMRIDELPSTLVIVGGGYVAAELAHVFGSLGVAVRIVTKGPALLTAHDGELSRAFTELARARWQLHLSTTVTGAVSRGGGVAVHLTDGSSVEGDLLLIATGRQPNSDLLKLEAAGVDVRDDGRIRVDEFGRTSAEGVWALGDVSSAYQLKHVANAEARTVAHNLVASQTPGTQLRPLPTMPVPSAVFTDPQVAAVGRTKEQLEAAGMPFITSTVKYADTAFGWAMEDRDSFCRLYAHPHTRLLLGAHIMGPQAATLIQPLIYAMSLGRSCDDIVRGQYWIHPALTEVVENALLRLQEVPQ